MNHNFLFDCWELKLLHEILKDQFHKEASSVIHALHIFLKLGLENLFLLFFLDFFGFLVLFWVLCCFPLYFKILISLHSLDGFLAYLKTLLTSLRGKTLSY